MATAVLVEFGDYLVQVHERMGKEELEVMMIIGNYQEQCCEMGTKMVRWLLYDRRNYSMLCDDGKELLEGETNESGEGGRAVAGIIYPS